MAMTGSSFSARPFFSCSPISLILGEDNPNYIYLKIGGYQNLTNKGKLS